jgi:beta-lactam-binding protein with PASTA domain
MPPLVGENLQTAQDILQSLGSYILSQEDATPAGRIQILDRNWYVCSQYPEAGATVAVSDLVTLFNVKLEEACP